MRITKKGDFYKRLLSTTETLKDAYNITSYKQG